MPSPNPTVRRQHSGNAVPTTLSAPIVNGTDTSFTITSATGWPDGSVGNFVVTINAGLSDVEKILCSTRSGTTVNVVTRGFDSTTAAGHASGAAVIHSISAVEIDEANQHTNATAAVHGVAGAVVGTTDAQTLTNKTLTAPTVNTPTVTAMTADATSTVGGVSGTQLAALPKGRAAGATLNAARSVGTLESAITGLDSVAVTAVVGRRYKVTVTLLTVTSVGSNSLQFKIRDGGGSAPTNVSTLLHTTDLVNVDTTNKLVHYHVEVSGLSAGTHTLGLFGAASSGTNTPTVGSATASALSYLTVEDIGT